MKLLYKPVGILCGLIAGRVSQRLAARIWSLVDEDEPPKATTERASWSRVLGAAAVQGATFAVTRAAVDRAGAKGFSRVFGVWPGEEEEEG